MFKTIILMIAVLLTSLVIAHPGGHGPPVDAAQALAIAENVAWCPAEEDFRLGFGQPKP